MKKIAFAAFASVAALSLAACGGSPAPEATESVETTPEEMMTGDATDVPTEAASEAM
jgi:ABC-type glycerol-3-phosphate transport system substrate-binding protein